MKYLQYVLAVFFVVIGLVAVHVAMRWRALQEWSDLQRAQMATIERLGEIPPAGWDTYAWRNALVSVINVWGNVTYHPNYSGISNAEMRELLVKLESIVDETTPENVFDSVDRVFQLLVERGRRLEFIGPYRDEFGDLRESRARQDRTRYERTDATVENAAAR